MPANRKTTLCCLVLQGILAVIILGLSVASIAIFRARILELENNPPFYGYEAPSTGPDMYPYESVLLPLHFKTSFM